MRALGHSNRKTSVSQKTLAAALWLGLALTPMAQPVVAQSVFSDAKPYDDRLNQLSEILGAVHFLRELCGNSDGQLWRDRMRELMDAEGSSALRRAKLTRSFNNGYRSYSRTYSTCTQSAQLAITRFLAQGAEIADIMVKTIP